MTGPGCSPGAPADPRHRRQVAEASHDAGATEEINEAEHRALDAIGGVLSS
jgi:hypothetical protein